MSAKSRVKPHPFIPDPDVPPDTNGRGACRTCHLIGEAGDAHHALPEAPAGRWWDSEKEPPDQ